MQFNVAESKALRRAPQAAAIRPKPDNGAHAAQLELGVDFTEGGKPENLEKNSQSTGEINNSTHISSKFDNQHGKCKSTTFKGSYFNRIAFVIFLIVFSICSLSQRVQFLNVYSFSTVFSSNKFSLGGQLQFRRTTLVQTTQQIMNENSIVYIGIFPPPRE